MNNPSSSPESLRARRKHALQEFQANRIRETYQDLAADPQFKKLVTFFFEEIYGPQDFGLRNEGIKTLHQKLRGFLKGEIIESVGKVIELNDLSGELDNLMVEKMIEQGVDAPLDWEKYSQIYRACDNYETRVYQIKLMQEATTHIHAVSQMRLIGLTLRAVNRAAHLAGYGKITEFLKRGYEAFHEVKDIDLFLREVERRENALNDRLFQIQT